MIEVSARVWSAWRRASKDDQEWTLTLALTPKQELGVAERAAREAALEAQQRFDAEVSDIGPDEPFAGEWSLMRTSDRVLINVTECDAFDIVLPYVVEGLERRGVAGKLGLWTPPPAPEPARFVPLLCCRICLRGLREHRGPRSYRWHPDGVAHRAALRSAIDWCRRARQGAVETLSLSTAGRVRVGADEDVFERIVETTDLDLRADFTNEVDGGVRALGAAGSLTLLATVSDAAGHRWVDELAGLVDLLRSEASHVAYAQIMRGWSLSGSLGADEAGYDWPYPPGHRPRGAGWTSFSFQDLYAPDPFGVQLLGPGYDGRVPDHPSWRAESVAEQTVLLQHVDPAAWFAEPFVPFGEILPPEQRAQPELLVEARRQLAPILYADGVLSQAGFSDLA